MERRVAEVYREYQQRLLAANAMDFDDLLLVTVNLLQACPTCSTHYQQRFRHVLVDEYQDTNRAQNELVLLLAGGHHQVSVVGDSDQSVYGWRGADIRNILQFEEAFPDATVVVLEQNYRSTQTILDAANAVIANNAMRKPKALWTEQGRRRRVVRYHAEDEHDEGRWLAAEIAALAPASGGGARAAPTTGATSPSSTAPTPRAGPSRRSWSGGTSPTRWWAAPGSTTGRRSRTCSPTCGPSPTRPTRCRSSGSSTCPSGASATPAWPASTVAPASTTLAFADVHGRRRGRPASPARPLDRPSPDLRTAAGRAAGRAAGDGAGLRADLLEAILERTGYLAELEAEHTVEAAGRIENIEELIGAAREADDLDAFLEQVSLVADADEVDGDASKVTLMTLHTAKGLEYPVVFIVGMEDGVFPHLRSLGEPDEMEEERRLAYVGHHPGPGAAVPVPRLVPQPVGPDPVQPAEPVPQGDPRRPGAGCRGGPPPGRQRSTPAGAVGTRSSSRPCDGERSARSTGPAPSCSACAPARPSSTPSGARAWYRGARARGTRPRPRSASRRSGRSTWPCPWPRSSGPSS